MLQQEPDIEIVAEAGNGTDAVAAIKANYPDLVFLDIQMPGLNGFEVLENLSSDELPLVVFVTAFDQHAVHAFDVHAVDYLLKPFDRTRLQACLTRVRTHQPYLSRVMVKSRGRIIFLKVEEIDWIETAGNYVEVHARKLAFLVRETLTALESKLDPKRFARVHRSTIVNVDRIQELQPSSHNDFLVLLKNGAKLRASRRYRDNLKCLP